MNAFDGATSALMPGENASRINADSLQVLGLQNVERLWARQNDLALEYYAISAGGHPQHANEDAIWSHVAQTPAGPILRVAVLDEASQKVHIESRAHLTHALRYLSCTVHEQAQIGAAALLNALHDSCASFVRSHAPRAKGGLSITLMGFHPDGYFDWASVGDVSLCHVRNASANRGWRFWQGQSDRVKLLNLRQREDNGRLQHAIGHGPAPLIQHGQGQLSVGERLLICSDGAYTPEHPRLMCSPHNASDSKSLAQLGEHLLAQGRLWQSQADDASLMLIQRLASPKI